MRQNEQNCFRTSPQLIEQIISQTLDIVTKFWILKIYLFNIGEAIHQLTLEISTFDFNRFRPLRDVGLKRKTFINIFLFYWKLQSTLLASINEEKSTYLIT